MLIHSDDSVSDTHTGTSGRTVWLDTDDSGEVLTNVDTNHTIAASSERGNSDQHECEQ